MLESDRGPLHDLSVALGLLLALILYAPAYLVLAAARRVAGVGAFAWRRAPV